MGGIYLDLSPITELENLQTRLLEYLTGSKMFVHIFFHSDRVSYSLLGSEEISIPIIDVKQKKKRKKRKKGSI